MFTLIRRLAARPSSRDQKAERQNRASHGPLVTMMECDLHNLDRLTWALSHPRR